MVSFLLRDPGMKPLRLLSLSILLALGIPTACASNLCGQACVGMIREAHALEGKGKYQEALDKYKAAEQAEPKASLPVSSAASLLLNLSKMVKPEKVEELRGMASSLATRALTLWEDDPIANEVLRALDDDSSPLHVPNPDAARLMHEAESLFSQRKLKEALVKYEAVMRADPKYSGAWVGAGDCHYSEGEWAKAEALFRRATELEPRNSQAWRYLADALFNQRKAEAAEAALISAITADPSQRPNWTKLAVLRAGAGMPLKNLSFRRGVRVAKGQDDKYTINIDEPADKKTDSPDFLARMALGVTEANLRTTDKAKSPYDIELAAWRSALKVADELKASTGKDLSDPALLQMRALAKDGQLEAAVLVLLFRQSYRPALEAWLAANPRGLREFIDRYGLRP
jgi:tetratricopeptide (TPR) repeat protein